MRIVEADLNARGDGGVVIAALPADTPFALDEVVTVTDAEADGTATARVSAVLEDADALLLTVDWDSFRLNPPALIQNGGILRFDATSLKVERGRRPVNLRT